MEDEVHTIRNIKDRLGERHGESYNWLGKAEASGFLKHRAASSHIQNEAVDPKRQMEDIQRGRGEPDELPMPDTDVLADWIREEAPEGVHYLTFPSYFGTSCFYN